jgi:hypothetical protein
MGIIRAMARLGLVLVLVLVLLTLTAVGCGENGDSSASGTTTSTTPVENTLPTPVAEKREAIVAAAKALDYDRLKTLLDPKTFSYSFAESGDPIGYWRRLEGEAEVPVLGDRLPTVFSAPWGTQGDIYVWPSVHGKPPSEWTPQERRWLRNLYTPREIRSFERAGHYLGWRTGIRKDGTWIYFIAGD